MNDWVFYKEVDFADKKILQYHIDTRDFYCLTNTEKAEKFPDISKLLKYPERFFHTPDEIVKMINRYYTDSGGEKEWRFFSLKGVDNWSMKYIRIYRADEGLLVCNNSHYALRKEILNEVVNIDY